MAVTSQVRGVQAVLTALKKEQVKGLKFNVEYTVGFTQKYALAVHETNKKYRVGGWKYLETPTRRLSNSGELGLIIRKAVKATGKIETGLALAALRIQRDAMKAVPIDTGALRGSAFTGKGKGLKEAGAAFARSERIRQQKKKK